VSGTRAVFSAPRFGYGLSYLNPAALVPTDPERDGFPGARVRKTPTSLVSPTGSLPGTTEICQAADRFAKGGNTSSSDDRLETDSSASAPVEGITPSRIGTKPGWISALMSASSLSSTPSIRIIAPFHFANCRCPCAMVPATARVKFIKKRCGETCDNRPWRTIRKKKRRHAPACSL